MSGYSGLVSRIKKCQKVCSFITRTPIRSIVFMDKDGELIWEEGVNYNKKGLLAVPLPMSIEDWEKRNYEEN